MREGLDEDEDWKSGENDKGEGPGMGESEDEAGEAGRKVLDDPACCERGGEARIFGIAGKGVSWSVTKQRGKKGQTERRKP